MAFYETLWPTDQTPIGVGGPYGGHFSTILSFASTASSEVKTAPLR